MTATVQVEQKSYEMPPKEGISVAFFLTVADKERSARWYEKVFWRAHLDHGRWQRASLPAVGQYLDDSERGRRAHLG
jgi:hypothetical protein